MSLVVGVGIPTLDRILAVPAVPDPDTSILVAARGAFGGGQVATALVAATRLGCSTELIASVGSDDEGHLVIGQLEAERVGTGYVRVIDKGRTATSVVLVTPDGGRTILYDPGEKVEPDIGETELALLGVADGIALAGTHAFTGEAVRAPRRPDSVTLLDLDAFDREEEAIVRECDVVIASAGYAAAHGLGPLEAARRLHASGATTAIVTRGAEGAVGVTADEEHTEPAHAVEVVDTTGAGDVYHGAYLVAALERRPLAAAMRFAAVAAGLKCRRVGGRSGIPRRDEVEGAGL